MDAVCLVTDQADGAVSTLAVCELLTLPQPKAVLHRQAQRANRLPIGTEEAHALKRFRNHHKILWTSITAAILGRKE